MGSLLVQTTFGERVVGILVWQSGKRSSENGFQTTFVKAAGYSWLTIYFSLDLKNSLPNSEFASEI